MATLLDYQNISIFKKVDMSHNPMNLFSQVAEGYLDIQKINPVGAALEFYLLNHLAFELSKHHPVDVDLNEEHEALMVDYVETTSRLGLHMFIYMFCICMREARHLSKLNDDLAKTPPASIHQKLKGNSGGQAVEKFVKLTQVGGGHANIHMVDVTQFLLSVFLDHHWGSSYGGKAWANITKEVHKFVTGDYSLEILLDTSFTLSHNCGPIFNKGFIFSNSVSYLLEVLDVQRSGQIPEYFLGKGDAIGNINNKRLDKMLTHIETVSEFVTFEETVDWQKVMDLGAVGSYHHKVSAKPKPAPKPEPVKATVTVGSITDEPVPMVKIYPGFIVVDASEKVKAQRKKLKENGGVEFSVDSKGAVTGTLKGKSDLLNKIHFGVNIGNTTTGHITGGGSAVTEIKKDDHQFNDDDFSDDIEI
jgi:hypothetical protein